MRLDDREVVRDDYASVSSLLRRRSIYEASEGPSALDVPWHAIVDADARDVRDCVASSNIHSHLADRVPELDAPLRARRMHAVFIAEKR